jgi:hypothetical protein
MCESTKAAESTRWTVNVTLWATTLRAFVCKAIARLSATWTKATVWAASVMRQGFRFHRWAFASMSWAMITIIVAIALLGVTSFAITSARAHFASASFWTAVMWRAASIIFASNENIGTKFAMLESF